MISTLSSFAVNTTIANCLAIPFEVEDSLRKDSRDNDSIHVPL